MWKRLAACALLGACGPTPEVAHFAPEGIVVRGAGPAGARADACYARDTTPAVIETVTEHVALEGAAFETRTEATILQERAEVWFETPCAAETDPVFITTLQRALAARGVFRGPATGVMDRATRTAVRAYQAPQGLSSGILSLTAARQLGLAIWDPDAAAGRGLPTPPSAHDISGDAAPGMDAASSAPPDTPD